MELALISKSKHTFTSKSILTKAQGMNDRIIVLIYTLLTTQRFVI